jgi:hypothetical protein
MMRRFLLMFAIVVAVFAVASAADDPEGPRYTGTGSLIVPAKYREWVFLSSGLGMTYGPLATAAREDAPAFDNVFVNRAAHDAFLKTGQWPDKTVFVLEVRGSESKGSINKAGHFQGTAVRGLEFEVKDGGKWTFYQMEKSGTEAKPFPLTASCYPCHAQNGAVDNTFVQFYPTLLPIAQEKGTFKASAH